VLKFAPDAYGLWLSINSTKIEVLNFEDAAVAGGRRGALLRSQQSLRMRECKALNQIQHNPDVRGC
jgi:hypothetical protein